MGSKLFLLVFGVLVVIVLARQTFAVKGRSGHQYQYQPERFLDSKILEVVTYNIQGGKDVDQNRDIRRATKLLSSSHIAGIQEVHGPTWPNKFGFGASQTEVLSNHHRFGAIFSPTRYRWLKEDRGNSILSTLPINRWETKVLPSQSRKAPRNMTIAELSWQGEKVIFVNTHLHTTQGRAEQLKIVLDLFEQHPRIILVGDFNTTSSDPDLSRFLEKHPQSDAIRLAGIEDNKQRIDWILVKGFKVHGGRMIEKGVSDHPLYAVRLSLE